MFIESNGSGILRGQYECGNHAPVFNEADIRLKPLWDGFDGEVFSDAYGPVMRTLTKASYLCDALVGGNAGLSTIETPEGVTDLKVEDPVTGNAFPVAAAVFAARRTLRKTI